MTDASRALVARLLEADETTDPVERAKNLLARTPEILSRAREAAAVTPANAATVDRFYSRTRRYVDGRPYQARRNGATRFWKTRPGEFRIPIKIGYKGYGAIDHTNAHEWAISPDFDAH